MKFATAVLLGILLLGSSASLNAQAAGSSQVVAAYINDPTTLPQPSPLPGFPGLCLVYYTMIGNLDLKSMFMPDNQGNPQVDRQHAYFIWVSDYNYQDLKLKDPSNPFTFTMILQGSATIYHSDHPDLRDWTNRSTWGDPVAKFVRRTGMFQSLDGGPSGTISMTAELVSSKPFTLNGKMFDFKELIPQGMTCSEAIAGWSYEAGTCVAIK